MAISDFNLLSYFDMNWNGILPSSLDYVDTSLDWYKAKQQDYLQK